MQIYPDSSLSDDERIEQLKRRMEKARRVHSSHRAKLLKIDKYVRSEFCLFSPPISLSPFRYGRPELVMYRRRRSKGFSFVRGRVLVKSANQQRATDYLEKFDKIPNRTYLHKNYETMI